MYYFTSDTHWGHANVIRYSNRPYAHVDEMDEGLIANWNATVAPGDTVYHLGDLAFAHENRAVEVVRRLNGQKFWIFGNHDKELKKSDRLRKLFVKCADYMELNVKDPDANRGGQKIILCHYPMITWNKSHHGAWMLHGHCHGNLRYPFVGRIMDVGVDPNNQRPISYDEVKAILLKRPITALDHHGGDESM